MAKLELKIDLISLLKRVEPDARRRRALTPILKQDSVKREFGKRIADKILERTNDGIDKNGRSFKAYAESYKKSLTFKIHGKDPGTVNLKLSGEMQAALDVTKTTSSAVILGFTDSELDKRASYHVREGVRTKRGKVFRDFFGLPDKEQMDILEGVISDFNNDSAIFDSLSTIEDESSSLINEANPSLEGDDQ